MIEVTFVGKFQGSELKVSGDTSEEFTENMLNPFVQAWLTIENNFKPVNLSLKGEPSSEVVKAYEDMKIKVLK